jgi:hypothetical protein
MTDRIIDADALARLLIASLLDADLCKTEPGADITSDGSDLFADVMAEADAAETKANAFLPSGQ